MPSNSFFAETRAALGLTMGGAARLVGVDTRTWERWEVGTKTAPEPVYRLLKVAREVPAALETLRRYAGTH
jgi:DNA-binding transcriptional regulator YiaG